jgi:hypothetical protein
MADRRQEARAVTAENDLYWRTGAEDAAMQDEHGFIWRAMLDTIDADVSGKRVLDAGCNREGSCGAVQRVWDRRRVRVRPGGGGNR